MIEFRGLISVAWAGGIPGAAAVKKLWAAQRLAEILEKNAPAGLRWHYEKMPEEEHATIFHPAALRAFRKVFKPIAPKPRRWSCEGTGPEMFSARSVGFHLPLKPL